MDDSCECCGRKLRADEGKVCRFCMSKIKKQLKIAQKGGFIMKCGICGCEIEKGFDIEGLCEDCYDLDRTEHEDNNCIDYDFHGCGF